MYVFHREGVFAVDYTDWAKVRMFRDTDVEKLQLWKYDGFNRLLPRYEM